MKEMKNYYFKLLWRERHEYLMSGLALPDPKDGPYHFIDCSIHPRLWKHMQMDYKDSKFTNTFIGVYE